MIEGDAIFLLFLVCSADLHINTCAFSGPFSPMLNFTGFCLCTNISTLVFFFFDDNYSK